MQWLQRIVAWLLLATIVAGGVVGPPLHRVQHAIEEGATPGHTHATEGPVWCGASIDITTPDCVLCTTRLVVVPPSGEQTPAPYTLGWGWEPIRTHLTSADGVAVPLIRGPPEHG
ncbi:MAG: hypothetical protein R6T83_08810 [Salinibacter sp.]